MTNEKAVAEKLLQVNAVRLNPQQPFTWASGWKSPIYCDNRITLSHPRIRTYIRQELVKMIDEKFGTPDIIAGVATGAIAHGVLVAEALGLPFVYVRAAAKDHGRQNVVEGELSKNQTCVVIEDLISTGKSSLQVVEVLKELGLDVIGMVSIFTYGFPVATQAFSKASLEYYSLTDYPTLIGSAIQKGIVSADLQDILLKWRDDPAAWKGGAI